MTFRGDLRWPEYLCAQGPPTLFAPCSGNMYMFVLWLQQLRQYSKGRAGFRPFTCICNKARGGGGAAIRMMTNLYKLQLCKPSPTGVTFCLDWYHPGLNIQTAGWRNAHSQGKCPSNRERVKNKPETPRERPLQSSMAFSPLVNGFISLPAHRIVSASDAGNVEQAWIG